MDSLYTEIYLVILTYLPYLWSSSSIFSRKIMFLIVGRFYEVLEFNILSTAQGQPGVTRLSFKN